MKNLLWILCLESSGITQALAVTLEAFSIVLTVDNKQLMNEAFIGYEELCRSKRVLSVEVDNTL